MGTTGDPIGLTTLFIRKVENPRHDAPSETLQTDKLKYIGFEFLTAVVMKSTNVSDEHIASIFKAE
jgi:hypothetical protein